MTEPGAADVPQASIALVDVVLPCLNEAAALPWVLSRLPEGYRAIVVDNGSTDASAEIARAAGATVVAESRRGFGAAAHAGLLAATAPIVAFCDADASMDPSILPVLVRRITDGRTELILGRRVPTTRGAWPLHARFANREGLLSLDLRDRRSGYPLEMLLKASAAGWRIEELDTPYSPRVGRSKVTGTIRGTYTAVKDMSKLLREVQ